MNCEQISDIYCAKIQKTTKSIAFEVCDTAINTIQLIRKINDKMDKNINIFRVEIIIDMSTNFHYILESNANKLNHELFYNYISTINNFLKLHPTNLFLKIGIKLPSYISLYTLYLYISLIESCNNIDFVYCNHSHIKYIKNSNECEIRSLFKANL